MNARLVKEIRDLLPIFACTLPLIVVPQLIWPNAGFGNLALGVACVLMAGSVFGAEFQHRTLSLLLSQPIPRSVIWRDKMLVLGAGMMTSLVALLGCLAVYRPETDGPNWLTLVFIPLCAFCGAPFWTMALRQGIGGMVAAVGVPCGILAVYALVTQQFSGAEPATLVPAILCLLVIYCAVVYWRGYATFNRLEVVDASARELSLPTGLEAFFMRPLARLSSRFRGPFASLLKKEFRLQQVSFLLAGLFFLIAVGGFCLIRSHPGLGEAILGGGCLIYVVSLPLIAGAISVAEEKGWELAEWHLTLPPSALQQWTAKMLVGLSTSLALGLLLPAAMVLGGEVANLGDPGARISFPPASEIRGWVIGQLLMTSVAMYAASFSRNTLRAILAAFAVIVAGCAFCVLLGSNAATIIALRLLVLRRLPVNSPDIAVQLKTLTPLLFAGGAFLMLCVVQWFAWSNFRRCGASAGRIVVQLLVVFSILGLIALAITMTIFAVVSRH